MNPLSVMVVDDSMVMTQLIANALKELGHKVAFTANTGEDAIKYYPTCNPDLVTMDVTMPGMGGIAATEQIMRTHPNARVIMITSHGHGQVAQDAVRVGAKGYVLKPVKSENLRVAIDRVFKPSEVRV